MKTRPFQGRFVIRRLGLSTINLYTKNEISTFTRYEDMKGDKTIYKLWWFEGLGVTQCHQQLSHLIRAYTTSYSTLIETNRLSCIPFSSYRAFSLESGQFYLTPLAFVATVGRDPVRIAR